MKPPRYPPGASFLLITECIVTVEGLARDCAIVAPKPELQELETEVLRAMATARWKPVTYQGRPIEVRYVFNIRIVLPMP